jgi:transmembrane sensor
MERPVRAKFNTQIYEEACEWFIECRAGDLDDHARAEFDRWLRKSPEHQSAYLEIAAIWNEAPGLDPANRWDLSTLIAQAAEDSGNVVALEPAQRTTNPTPQSVPNRTEALEPVRRAPAVTVSRRNLFAIAASLLFVTAAITTYLLAPRGVYSTALGEQRSLALNDGSTVQLNSLSKIRIRYTERERTIDLLQGQALFHVAKDSARPFVVYSGQTRVKAVGTQFDVYRKTAGTIVTVVEGRVAVIPPSGPGTRGGPTPGPHVEPAPGTDVTQREQKPALGTDLAQRAGEGAILLAAGEQITVTTQAAQKTAHPNVAGATAWTQRQLVFNSAPLADVAEEFNRYNERKLIIDPSALGGFHISGVFSSTDPTPLIRFLRDRPGLRVSETATEIRVEKDL